MRYKAIKTRLKLDKDQKIFLLLLMRASKNLYNEALYNVRQHFFNTGMYLTYENNYHLLKTSENYRTLNSSQAQAVIKKVDEAMKAFFGSIKAKSNQKVRLPRYLDKLGYYSLIDRLVYKPKSNYYNLPRGNFIKRISKYFKLSKKDLHLSNSLNLLDELYITIETPKCIIDKQIKEITIKQKFDGKYIYVIHTYIEEDILEDSNLKTETMGIDLGFNNLATCAVTNAKHLLIDGRKLKSLNQWYHKRMSALSSKRPNQHILTNQMIKLIEKRNNQMIYGINKAARLIINHALTNNVGEIIIGYNKDFKDINLSKQYNQMAKSIPLAKLRDRVVYLAKEYGIITKIINESYTSKASYLDNDVLPELDYKKHTFSGKRVKRGLYISKEGISINADLNAALNILRKGNPKTKKLGYSGVNTRKRTYLFG
ncbi:MAG: putative transposase [Candidatus Izimaplasma bacterium HR2]|nr:MAG: putative transposase [Candidatus Izimaplasma bacterium HR2]